MKKIRFTIVHMSMLALIFFGLLALVMQVASSRTIQLMCIFLVLVAMLALNYYQGMDQIEKRHVTHSVKDELPTEAVEGLQDSLVDLLDRMPVGVIRFEPAGNRVIWYNPYAELVFASESGEFNQELVRQVLSEQEDGSNNHRLFIDDRKYIAYIDRDNGMFYFFDYAVEGTEGAAIVDKKPVIGIISVDNYDDLLEGRSDAETSSVNGFIANMISDFAKEYHIFYRRVDMDRYYFFTDYAILKELMTQQFPLLENFKKEAQERELPLTLSLGISFGDAEQDRIGQIALQNLNLALVRGGDQAIVKENSDSSEIQYFGGGSASTIKRSRTRTRAMMTAIADKIRSSERVFVVGHRNLDLDALGASVGMQVFARNLIEESYVVYDDSQMSPDIARAIQTLREDGQTQLLTVDQALNEVTPASVLIMVDHSKITLTLSEKLYKQFTDVIVVDHHRRDEDFPDNASISFIESGASSASELVTELIQFQNGSVKLSRAQASVLMSGIMLDTKNFTSSVTSRTFDVASYLRSRGSDSTSIQYIAATDYADYRQVNELILTGRQLYPNVIVAVGDDRKVYSNVLASKAADTLLSMSGIEASFAIVRLPDHRVAVSARSRGDINVQRIMEQMGGGGHFNLAACQIEGKSVNEVFTELTMYIEETFGHIEEAIS